MGDKVPPGVRLGIVRGISYGLFGKPDTFVPQLRALGAGLVRVYLYWSQLEPEPGRFSFEAVDAFLDQLDGSEEVWVTVCSSSRWATEQATDFLPPSPAKDPDAYHRFVHRLVRHCAGRVRFWQCDNEPCNLGLTWAGTAAQYVAQLQVLHRAVKDADPGAVVVLGGAPYGLPASAADNPDRQFFDVLLRDGRDFFDVFDLHLYGETDRIIADIETARGMMRAFGYEKPLVAGEYNAPWLNLYPEATAAMEKALADAASEENPERAAIASLYEHMASQPPQLQMFMRGCPPELKGKRHRINRREIVMRNLLALSAGVRRTACWNLAPEIPGFEDPLSPMDLLFGKFPLLGYEGTELRRRNPSAEAFSLLAERLAGVDGVTRVQVPGRPSLMVFEVRRRGRDRCWWCGSSATPSPARTSRRWRSPGRGRRRGRPPWTRSVRPGRSSCATAGWSSRCRSHRCSSPPTDAPSRGDDGMMLR